MLFLLRRDRARARARRQRNPHFLCQLFEYRRKVRPVHLLQKTEDIPALATTKALVRPALGRYMEGRRAFFMKRTSARVAPSRPPQSNILPDNIDNIDTVFNLLNISVHKYPYSSRFPSIAQGT